MPILKTLATIIIFVLIIFVGIPRAGQDNAVSPLLTQILNSGMSLEQVAQMMNLSTLEVRRLVGEDFRSHLQQKGAPQAPYITKYEQ